MTDAVWLLWNRALVDYGKAAMMWLQTRIHRDAGTKQPPTTDQPDTEQLQPSTA